LNVRTTIPTILIIITTNNEDKNISQKISKVLHKLISSELEKILHSTTF